MAVNVVIGSHRLRDYMAGYVIEYRQKTRDGSEKWREKCYPQSIESGLTSIIKYELKLDSIVCAELSDLLKATTALADQVRASAQLIATSMSV